MDKEPVKFMQCDPKWGKQDYSTEGEKTTICESGCGTTSMAMAVSTLLEKMITPAEVSDWSKKNGFKALRQGTYYSFFGAYAKHLKLKAYRLNRANLRNAKDTAKYHKAVIEELEKGNLVIACMGKGLWTNSGHYILLWQIKDGVAYINDPASSKTERTRGSWERLKAEVKYYFIIENPKEMKKVKIRYKDKDLEVEGMNKNGTVYVKVRELLMKMGFRVEWEKESKTVIVNQGDV